MAHFWWSAKGAMNVGNPEPAFEIVELRNVSLQARRDQSPRRRTSPSRSWSIPGRAWPATRRPDFSANHDFHGYPDKVAKTEEGLERSWPSLFLANNFAVFVSFLAGSVEPVRVQVQRILQAAWRRSVSQASFAAHHPSVQ